MLLSAVVQGLQIKVHFHTAFAMSLEMLAILHISLVIKIPKGTKISTRDRGHIAADKGAGNKISEHMYNLNNVFIIPQK